MYSDTIELLYLTQFVGECHHVPTFLFVGDFGINLCGADIRVSEHFGKGFDGNAVGQADFCRHSMAAGMENIVHLRIWKNIENKLVTCCELVDFLYSASMIGKQFDTEY